MTALKRMLICYQLISSLLFAMILAVFSRLVGRSSTVLRSEPLRRINQKFSTMSGQDSFIKEFAGFM